MSDTKLSQPPQRPAQTRAVRMGKRLRDPVNRWFARRSLIGDEPFVPAEAVPGLAELQRNWRAIRDELLPLLRERDSIPALADVSPDHRRIAPPEKWKSLFLKAYGYRSTENCARCPRTSALLDKVPGLVVAFFSIMEPGTKVPLHRGLTKAWLNCHLALVVPQGAGRCEIEVAGQLAQWHEGEWLVFDETNPHQVWNERSEERVVLFLQVRRPMTFVGKLASKLLYHAVRRTSFVQDGRRKLQNG